MAKSPLSFGISRIVFAAWWLVWFGIQWSVLSEMGISSVEAITDSAVSNILLGGCCLVIINNMRYYLPRQEKYWYVFTVSLILSFLWLIILRSVLFFIFKSDSHYTVLLKQSSTIRFGFAFLMIGCVSAISLLWFTQLDKILTDNRQKEIEQLAKDAELFKLRQQLQPHFLFNSLNSVSALIGSQPEKARHMIQQLSDFLRGTLKKEEHQWNTLHEEIQYLQLYLDIEKVRFGHRLQTTVQVEETAAQCLLPALLLQPVVENAIKFGLYDTMDEVSITIHATQQTNMLHITVTNPYDASTATPSKGTGFGLASVKRRLFLLFGRANLLITQPEHNIFITTILIPQKI